MLKSIGGCTVACLGLWLSACAPRYVPQGSHRDFERGEKILYARRAAELQECVDPNAPGSEEERACTDRVRAAWKPTEHFLSEMHRVWCDAKPGDCPTGGPLPQVPDSPPPAATPARPPRAP